VLTASAEPDKAFWYGIPAPAGAPFCGCVQSAKTGGFIDQLAGSEKRLGVLTVGENKTHHRPKALHLTYGDRISWIVGQTWISYHVHVWSAGEQRRQRQGIVALAREA